MIDEIVKMVAKKAKIPEAVALIAVNTVIGALKKKLPGNVGSLVESFVNSDGKKGKDADAFGDLASIAGKLLGGGKK